MTEHTPLQDDTRIDAVLHALSHAEPDQAMQARLITALHTANSSTRARHAARPRWMVPVVSASPSRWLALAACLLVLIGTSLHQLLFHSRTGSAVQPAATYALRERGGPPILAAPATGYAPGPPGQQPVSTAAPLAAASLSARAHLPRLPIAVPPGCRTGLHGTEVTSFPPPPLPMTEQEHLLLRLGRHEPAEQLALLTLPAQDAAFQQGKAAVDEFFAPSPPLRSQDDSPSIDHPAGQQ